MARYMLLLYDDPSVWATVSPEEMQKAIEKYRAWMSKSVMHARLADDAGKVIRPQKNGTPRATDGPFSETKEILGGYYTIEAESYEQAAEISMSHPHLEYGGTIVLRKHWGE